MMLGERKGSKIAMRRVKMGKTMAIGMGMAMRKTIGNKMGTTIGMGMGMGI